MIKCKLAVLESGEKGLNGETNSAGKVREVFSSCHECHGIWGDNATNELKYSRVFLGSFLCVRVYKIPGTATLRK